MYNYEGKTNARLRPTDDKKKAKGKEKVQTQMESLREKKCRKVNWEREKK